MYIYTNGQTTMQTPAHVYNGTQDFVKILEDMKKGEFPVGTGQPFPVNFDSEEQQLNPDASSPWVQHCTNPQIGGPPVQPIGPEIFGL